MRIKRSEYNPILEPMHKEFWEAEAVFNGCPIQKEENGIVKTYMVYRALSKSHYHEVAKERMMVSDVGIAESTDGGNNFENRRKFIEPEEQWDRYGCEDPRITFINNKYYIFYTALSEYPFSAKGIRVGVAISPDLKKVTEKHPVTTFNAKGMALFPEKINGKFWAILTVNTDLPPAKICLTSFEKEEEMWSEDYWNNWYPNHDQHALNLLRGKEDQVEVGSPPIKTKEGWLIIYSYTKNYYTREPIFTIEAALLDLEDPSKIIARTETPILTPEEYYEKIGMVENVVFPSGALLNDDKLEIYYGASDTFCCKAEISIQNLLDHMVESKKKKAKFSRSEKNPILIPDVNSAWENKAVFNPASLYLNGKFHIIYRAMSWGNTSTMGYATSSDGTNIDYKSPDPVYIPRESFEDKKISGGNSGCEDPRLTHIEDKIYMCYTAFDGVNVPRVALTWILEKDFLDKKWNWSKPVLISAPNLDDKDAMLFPQKYDGKYIFIHRIGEDMDIAYSEDLNFNHEEYLEEQLWIYPRKGWWDSKKVGVSAPPVRTPEGWVMLYHGVSDKGVYRVGAVLLDLNDPSKILGRTDCPIFEPEMEYEKNGQVNNVVFPCGANLVNNELFIFYGGADTVIGMGKVDINQLLEVLKSDGWEND